MVVPRIPIRDIRVIRSFFFIYLLPPGLRTSAL